MDRKILIARLRQLQAVDLNALDIYTELSELAGDKNQCNAFLVIAKDEKRHVALDKQMLSLLEQ
jgi:rubrerythrin